MCPDCFGHRSGAGLALQSCYACSQAPGPCALHKCRRCDGSGLVCPQCRGDRQVRIGEWEEQEPYRESVRCDVCTEGNQINPAKESRAIERWIRKHVPDAAQAQLEVVK